LSWKLTRESLRSNFLVCCLRRLIIGAACLSAATKFSPDFFKKIVTSLNGLGKLPRHCSNGVEVYKYNEAGENSSLVRESEILLARINSFRKNPSRSNGGMERASD